MGAAAFVLAVLPIAGLAGAALTGCGPPGSRDDRAALANAARAESTALSDASVRPVDETGPEMRDAIRRARATTPELLRRLVTPPATQTVITASVRLVEGEEVEHIWLDHLRYDGRVLAGTLNDDPVRLRHVRRGDRVRARPEQIVDWMAIDAGRLCGGYTLRLERRHLPDAARQELDRQLGLTRVPGDSSTCAPDR